MRNLIYAFTAAAIATFATSSLIAVATAAPLPDDARMTAPERELVAVLDGRLHAQLEAIKARLDVR